MSRRIGSGSKMLPETRRVLDTVCLHTPVTTERLRELLPDVEHHKLGRRLNNLQQLGYLQTKCLTAGNKLRHWFPTAVKPGGSAASAAPTVANDQAEAAALVDRVPPEIVPPRTMDVLFTNAEPDRKLPYRADAFDFLRCSSRTGNHLTPLTEIHHDPR